MPIFPYEDEEERRRRAIALPPPLAPALPDIPTRRPRMLPPPGMTDTPERMPGMAVESSLPETVMPGLGPLPARGAPGAAPSPMPSLHPPGRSEQLNEARDVYMLGTPGRGKSALRGAFEGFLGGGGLLGAATGAAYGAIDPRGLRERRFNQEVRPRIQERFAYEDADRAAARQAAEDALNNQYKTAQIGALDRSNRPQPPRPQAPVRSDRGLYDLGTGRIIPGTEPLPKEEKPPGPHWVRDASGNYVDLNAPATAGKKVRGYDRPREPKESKEKAKYIPLSKVREYAKARGIKLDEAKAKARADGYTVVD